MENNNSNIVKYNIINSLKKPGNPIIIYALPQEAEAIFYACKNEGVNVSAFCDNEKRKSNKKYCGLDVIYTPDLAQKFPKARVIIAHQKFNRLIGTII